MAQAQQLPETLFEQQGQEARDKDRPEDMPAGEDMPVSEDRPEDMPASEDEAQESKVPVDNENTCMSAEP